MLGMFYEKKFSRGELRHIRKIQEWRHNPNINRRIKVGGEILPMTVDDFELIHALQKLEDRYKDAPEDKLKDIDEDLKSGEGIIIFHLNNINGWHP